MLSPATFYEHPRHDGLFRTSSASTRYLPDWKFVRYIKLYDEDLVLYGLTVFCSFSGGITGLGTHFASREPGHQNKTYWTGRQDGYPIHFRLKPEESIMSMWVCWRADGLYVTPFIAVGDTWHSSVLLLRIFLNFCFFAISFAVYLPSDPFSSCKLRPGQPITDLICVYLDTNKRTEKLCFRAPRLLVNPGGEASSRRAEPRNNTRNLLL